MNTCDGCKWYDLNHLFDDVFEPHCTNDKVCGSADRYKHSDDACWIDDSFYSLEVGPKFGCIHWEAI